MNQPTLYKKDPRGSWYVRKMIDGKRKAWCTGTTNQKEAMGLAKGWIKSLVAGKNDVLRKAGRRREVPTIGEAISAFLASGLRKCQQSTATDYVHDLRSLMREGGELTDQDSLDELTPGLVQAFYNHRLAGKDAMAKASAAVTANKIYRNARSIFGKRGIKKGVFGGLELPLELLAEFRSQPFEDEVEATYELPSTIVMGKIMGDAARIRDEEPDVYVAFLLTLALGIRRGEATWLKWENLSMEDGQMVAIIQPTWQHLTKNKKGRRVPVHPSAIHEIRNISENGCYLVPGSDNNRKDMVWRKLGAWFKSHGWDRHGKAHEMRKFFGAQVATQLGLYAAQKYLGHSSPVITNKYYADLVDIKQPALALPGTIAIEGGSQ